MNAPIQDPEGKERMYKSLILLALFAALILSCALIWDRQLPPEKNLANWAAIITANLAAAIVGFTLVQLSVGQYIQYRAKRQLDSSISGHIDRLIPELHMRLERIEKDLRPTIQLEREIDWKALFDDASTVTILVQSWDGWVRDHRAEIINLLQRQGCLSLFMLDPSSGKNADLEANAAHKFWASRMCEDDAKKSPIEIRKTADYVARHAKEASGGFLRKFDETEIVYWFSDNPDFLSDLAPEPPQVTGRATISAVKGMIWYCLFVFSKKNDEDSIYIFSPYAHHHKNIGDVPFFFVRKGQNKAISQYFDRELDTIGLSVNRRLDLL